MHGCGIRCGSLTFRKAKSFAPICATGLLNSGWVVGLHTSHSTYGETFDFENIEVDQNTIWKEDLTLDRQWQIVRVVKFLCVQSFLSYLGFSIPRLK